MIDAGGYRTKEFDVASEISFEFDLKEGFRIETTEEYEAALIRYGVERRIAQAIEDFGRKCPEVFWWPR